MENGARGIYDRNWAFAVGLLFIPIAAGPVSGCTVGDDGAGRREVGGG